MARGRENGDFQNKELDGVIDFMHLSTGGASVSPVSEREFNFRTKEGMAEYEKFMREPVEIVIHATGDRNEPLGADISLNGVPCPLPREVPLRIPRAFVEVLAQSQTRHYSQERVKDPDATEGMKTRRHVGSDYRFRVRKDPNPKGEAWLSRVMHCAA